MTVPAPAAPHPGWVRARVSLRYDGTEFSGWARQPDQPTVQAEVERAFGEIDSRIGAVVCAGRTDAGVHARAQVIHVDIPADVWVSRGPGGVVHQLNQLTSDQIHFVDAQSAPRGFDARFSALSRTYSYRLCDDAAHWDPLSRRWVTMHKRTLDVGAMARAAQVLLGEHDFMGFCKPRAGASLVRRVLRLEVYRDARRRVVVTIEADAFCHSMVRALVGALVAVGEHRRDDNWIAGVLASPRRDSAVTVMPPQGLVLEAVAYPPDEFVAERAVQTRRLREPLSTT